MKFSDIKITDKKFHQFLNDDSYRVIEYKNHELKISELIWNSTNITPPNYVLDITNKFALDYNGYGERYPTYQLKINERYFGYKTPSSYIKDRSPVLKFYWEHNFFNCKEMYSSYEEFFAISCVTMTKQRLELKVYNGIQ